MSRRLPLVSLLGIIVGIVISTAQVLPEVSARADKRTLRERADEAMQKGAPDSVVISLYEQWLNAVPMDAEAARQLSLLYTRVGRTADAAIAASMATETKPPADPRIQTVNTLQVRMGTYKVLLPSVMKPAEKYPAVLVLHGNGHTEDTMVEWVKSLKMDSVIFVFPRAPYAKIPEIMASHRPRFSGSGPDLGFPDSLLTDVVEATAAWYHDALTDASARFPVSKVKPVVIGFSQGGFLSYAVATKYPQTFQSVVSICASMYQYGNVQRYFPTLASYGIDALVMHAKSDPVVPFQTGEMIAALLKDARVKCSFEAFEGGHWPSDVATARVRQWLHHHLH
ncbi:MAG: dienelactone hydrolase family protein [Bradyrhizobiaceae bacterium]|nr:dienelactone hydrolase family protein [Bradyrhizobiaceae bacterium]